jgi:hypothetical protein
MSLRIYPYSWNTMPQLFGSDTIDESDESCLQELKAVLERHGKTSKFCIFAS